MVFNATKSHIFFLPSKINFIFILWEKVNAPSNTDDISFRCWESDFFRMLITHRLDQTIQFSKRQFFSSVIIFLMLGIVSQTNYIS